MPTLATPEELPEVAAVEPMVVDAEVETPVASAPPPASGGLSFMQESELEPPPSQSESQEWIKISPEEESVTVVQEATPVTVKAEVAVVAEVRIFD